MAADEVMMLCMMVRILICRFRVCGHVLDMVGPGVLCVVGHSLLLFQLGAARHHGFQVGPG